MPVPSGNSQPFAQAPGAPAAPPPPNGDELIWVLVDAQGNAYDPFGVCFDHILEPGQSYDRCVLEYDSRFIAIGSEQRVIRRSDAWRFPWQLRPPIIVQNSSLIDI